MLRHYLARRKMRWAVRRLAQMTPLMRPPWRRPHIKLCHLCLSPAEAEKADRIERFYFDALDSLNPTK
jgi:hypothetical protein